MTSAYEQKSESVDPKELFDVLLLLLDFVIFNVEFKPFLTELHKL